MALSNNYIKLFQNKILLTKNQNDIYLWTGENGSKSPPLVSWAWNNIHIPKRCQCRMGALWGVVYRAKGPLCAGAESFAEGFQVLATSRDTRTQSSSVARGAAATWRTRYITLGAKGPVNPVLLYGWPWTLFYCEVGNDQSQKPEFGEKTPSTMGERGSKDEIALCPFPAEGLITSQGEKHNLELFRGKDGSWGVGSAW